MRLHGYPGVTEIAVNISYTKAEGWRTERTFTGPGDQIRNLSGELKSLGATDIRHQAMQPNRMAQVTAVFGGADDSAPPENRIESSWELDEADPNADLWGHPKVLALFQAYGLEDMVHIRKIAVAMALGDWSTITDSLAPQAKLIFAALQAIPNYREFSKRLLRENGQATYYAPTQVLRHTLSGPQDWGYDFPWAMISKLTSSAEIQMDEPSLWVALPPDKWWLTHAPRLTQMANGTLTVMREWHEVEYDTFRYELLHPPVA